MLPVGNAVLGAGEVQSWCVGAGRAQSLVKPLVLPLHRGSRAGSPWHTGWEETFLWYFLEHQHAGTVFVSAQARTEEFLIPKEYQGCVSSGHSLGR